MAVDPFETGSYAYMEQLELMNSCTPSPETPVLPERWARIKTPLKAEEWEWELRDLPDRRCASFLVKGISEGFRLGFDYTNNRCTRARRNMLSAGKNPQVVEEYLNNEIALGRVHGRSGRCGEPTSADKPGRCDTQG